MRPFDRAEDRHSTAPLERKLMKETQPAGHCGNVVYRAGAGVYAASGLFLNG